MAFMDGSSCKKLATDRESIKRETEVGRFFNKSLDIIPLITASTINSNDVEEAIPGAGYSRFADRSSCQIRTNTANHRESFTSGGAAGEAVSAHINNNFSNDFDRNPAKIRLHDPDVNPRPRRPNDTSSRYYPKSDGSGQIRGGIGDGNRSLVTGGGGGGGGGARPQYNYRGGSPSEVKRHYHQTPGSVGNRGGGGGYNFNSNHYHNISGVGIDGGSSNANSSIRSGIGGGPRYQENGRNYHSNSNNSSSGYYNSSNSGYNNSGGHNSNSNGNNTRGGGFADYASSNSLSLSGSTNGASGGGGGSGSGSVGAANNRGNDFVGRGGGGGGSSSSSSGNSGSESGGRQISSGGTGHYHSKQRGSEISSGVIESKYDLPESDSLAPPKTEAPRQTGPESRVPGRENIIPPASRRWVPPSLRRQYGLTQEAKNDTIFRKVRGILNKLTPENFKGLKNELLSIDLNSPDILKGVIILIFDKSVDEPKYSLIYAHLCERLSKEAPNFETSSDSCTFLRLLIGICRETFKNRSKINCEIINHDDQPTADEEEKRYLTKHKMLGNVKFIAELFKLHILTDDVLHTCIQQLLFLKSDAPISAFCEDVECLNQLIRTCGKILDTQQSKKLMDQYFGTMDKRSKLPNLPPRIRFMLRDLIELRNNNWIPRKVSTTDGPVPIRHVRPDDDNMIRPAFLNRSRATRYNNDRDCDNWMNKLSLNLPAGNDYVSSYGITSSSHLMSPGYNSNRNPNQTNNQNNHLNNYNNRYNKHNNNNHNQHNSHNNSSYSSMSSNKDLAPRFRRNLITATQEQNDNIQMRPSANSLIFKVNTPPPPILPMSLVQQTPRTSTTSSSSSSSGYGRGNTGGGIQVTSSRSPLLQSNSDNNSTSLTTETTPNNTSSSNSSNLNTTTTSNTNLNTNNCNANSNSINNSNNSISVNQNQSQKTPTNQNQNQSTVGNNALANNTVVNNKDSSLTKQGSIEKPAKQNKKDKGPNKEEVMKKVMTFLNENLIVDEKTGNDKNMDDVLATFYELKVPDKFMKDTCISILNEVIDKSDQQYDRCIDFIQQLRKKNKLSANALLDSFRQIVNRMSEKEVTIPRITTLVASLLARAVCAKLCKLSDIATYTENGQHYPLFLLVLQQLHRSMGKQALGDLFIESKVNLMHTLPEADRNKDRMAEILEDRNLSFLYPLLKVQSEMLKQITTEPTPAAFFKWIKDNVDARYHTDTGFITALITVLLKYITQETTLAEGVDIKKVPESDVIEKEKELSEQFCRILPAFFKDNNDWQLLTIYTLQVFCFNAQFPKNMLCRWFSNLYYFNVIEEETFMRWREEICDDKLYPGKGESLFQVNSWLTWLDQAEYEDDD